MKKIYIFLLFIFTLTTANAKIITGEVSYTLNSARNEVMSQTPKPVSSEVLRANIYDTNNRENKTTLLQGKTEVKDRILAYFSDGSYGVMHKNNPTYVFYYNNEGILTHTEVKDSLKYPYKTYKYNTTGKLINMTLRVSENETFIFKPTGELIAHWINDKCYDENNNIIMTRNILK